MSPLDTLEVPVHTGMPAHGPNAQNVYIMRHHLLCYLCGKPCIIFCKQILKDKLPRFLQITMQFNGKRLSKSTNVV